MVPKSWKRGFEAAKAASYHSNGVMVSHRLGSAMMQGGKVVSIGFNTYGKTHPDSKYKNIYRNVHAEQSALIKRQYYDISSTVMYVFRQTADGKPACSRPCPMCEKRMRDSNIKKVRFFNEAGEAEELSLRG